jgi:hypothetical protein
VGRLWLIGVVRTAALHFGLEGVMTPG